MALWSPSQIVAETGSLRPGYFRKLQTYGVRPHHAARPLQVNRLAARFSRLPFTLSPSPAPPAGPFCSFDGGEEPEGLYCTLLQQAEDITFNCPASQLHGRAGRRGMLEDAERMLELCIQERPQQLQPRVLLLRNLMRQSLGRERDVPALALEAIHAADLASPGAAMMRHLHVLQVVMLGLKALYKLCEEGQATPLLPSQRALTVESFLAEACAAAPSCAADFDKLAHRVKRQLLCCSREQRLALLYDRDGYMSSVDLSAVCGQHHAGAEAVVVDMRL